MTRSMVSSLAGETRRSSSSGSSRLWKKVLAVLGALATAGALTSQWLIPKIAAELRTEWKTDIRESESLHKDLWRTIDRRLERMEDALQRLSERGPK